MSLQESILRLPPARRQLPPWRGFARGGCSGLVWLYFRGRCPWGCSWRCCCSCRCRATVCCGSLCLFGREEWMLQGISRRESLFWVPGEALRQEVEEFWVCTVNCLVKRLTSRLPPLSTYHLRVIALIEECRLTWGSCKY